MKLSKETINELGIILREEFSFELNPKELEIFAYNLLGYFTMSARVSGKKFVNHPSQVVEKDK